MMYHRFPKPILRLFICFLLPALALHSQEPEPEPDPRYEALERRLEDLLADESLTSSERLMEQARILRESIESGLPIDDKTWQWMERLLEEWERSADLEKAREAYLSLLGAVASVKESADEPLVNEQAFRNCIQKALTLTRSPVEEGTFLFYLADSWFRSKPEDPGALRRAESLLLQAAMLLNDSRPKDAVHYRLGQLYWSLGREVSSGKGASVENSFLSRAVQNFRRVLRLPDAREALVSASRVALDQLLQPELVLDVGHRFLPQNDVRIRLRTRNIGTVKIEVRSLTGLTEEDVYPLSKLHSLLESENPSPESIRFSQSFTVRGRNPHDWHEREVRLGETFSAGWYGVVISGNGIERRDLLLVTPLEVAALPRPDGNLLVWVADAETGQPAANALVSVMDASGKRTGSGTTDTDGKILLGPDIVNQWEEIQVFSGGAPGHLRREDLPDDEPGLPWVATNPSEVPPGGTLQWSILGHIEGFSTEVTFLLPDGTHVATQPVQSGRGWQSGELKIPEDYSASGPVYVAFPDSRYLYVAHVRRSLSSPVSIEFSGEQLDPSLNLYLSSTPVGVQISPSFGSDAELPEFIRLEATRIKRQPVTGSPAGSTDAGGETIFEAILPFEEIDQGGVYVELPDRAGSEEIIPVRVEVLPLDSDEPIARAFLGMTPFRNVVLLTSGERIVRPGEAAQVSFIRSDYQAAGPQAVDGDLVIYRETWENRYIHRRRGTPLSEGEYLALPDRSLLGSAKTDYRLAEQGFVREEVLRAPIEVTAERSTVDIELDRPGYYNIEFDGRDVDSKAFYPEGPLEVWVVPDPLELRGFRSEKPRIVVEETEGGPLEILVLLDRSGTSVLFDADFADGTSRTFVEQPPESALFFTINGEDVPRLSACRVLAVGDRQTDLLAEVGSPGTRPDWELQSQELFGLNPGVEFTWDIRSTENGNDDAVLWTFFSDAANPLSPERLRWQHELQETLTHHPETAVAYLGRWLPLSHPFLDRGVGSGNGAGLPARPLLSPAVFATLFPEAKRFPQPLSEAQPFQAVEKGPGGEILSVDGRFPNNAGRWYLTLLSAAGHHFLKIKSWLISTELPIRTFVEGLSTMRVGDRALLPLSIENTTRDGVSLQVETTSTPVLKTSGADYKSLLLPPSGRKQVYLEVSAVQPGEGRIAIQVQRGGSSTEATHAVNVLRKQSAAEFTFSAASSRTALVQESIDLKGWLNGEILVCSGPGSLLPEIWPLLRRAEAGPEPLMAALGDWALVKVQDHHGFERKTEEAGLNAQLKEALLEYQSSSGGWTWLPQGDADPWLSAFIMWTLEIFSAGDSEAFPEIRRMGRSYLETILIDDSLPSESRLFALRALAVPAFHSGRSRPSRIQARSFLDFLHRRVELTDVEVAFLLQVAKAYHFNQEVRLLAADLKERIRQKGQEIGDFWSNSLYYLALDETDPSSKGNYEMLLRALNALSSRGATRSWEQVGGFLNLLAAYFWKGDFNMDGTVEVKIGTDDPKILSLNPDPQTASFLRHELSRDELSATLIPVRIDMTAALSPVIIAGFGYTPSETNSTSMEGARVRFFREFFEQTLLRGTRSRVTELKDNLEGIRVGDTIRVTLLVDNPEEHSYAEFRLRMPAGFALSSNRVEHVWEGAVEDPGGGKRTLSVLQEPANPLLHTVRLGPLKEGRHQLTFSCNVEWAGAYIWPPFQLLIPRTGQVFDLNEGRVIEVDPALTP